MAEQAMVTTVVRDRLVDARTRLRDASRRSGGDFAALLGEVDAALARLDRDDWGRCERCHDPIESERLDRDPLIRVCLGCLSRVETRALEDDLTLASTIQAGLLPPPELRAAGWDIAFRYRPAGVVSGDHADVLAPAVAGEPIQFALGDVSGKGVSAALLMSHLHAALRALAGMSLPLATTVERVNQVLVRGTPSNAFVTLVAGRLDRSGAVELSNAGHCPPLVVRDGTITSFPADGIPLGILNDARYSARRFRLEPGETLVVYSDGLSETENAAGEHLGERGLIEAVRAANGDGAAGVVASCLDRVRSHRGSGVQRDDLTILAIRRTG
jgi:sigma-B regulation protein RsbU (phosphoserine phosphatase)